MLKHDILPVVDEVASAFFDFLVVLDPHFW